MRPIAFLSRLFVILSIALVLASCTGLPLGAPSKQPVSANAQAADQAQQLEAQGDFAGAAEAYRRLAEASSAPLKQHYQLSAASAALRAGDVAQARSLVDAVDSADLEPAAAARRRLLAGEIALSEGNPQQALSDLEGATQDGLAPEVRAHAHLLRAEAYSVLGNHLESARERVLLEPLLTDPIALRDNQRAIVQALYNLPDPALQQLATPPDVLSGWMELVLIARGDAQNSAQFQQRIADWRHRYRQHPASDELIAMLPAGPGAFPPGAPLPLGVPLTAGGGAAPINYPQRIALLLPLSGRLAGAGTAVRDGFLAAAQQGSAARPDIRVYNVGAINSAAEATKTLQVYQQALQEGAEFVVGPLEKEGVKALYTLGPLSVPTLALNYNDEGSGAPFNLYQFGLAPEDEARQVAERAWLDGRTRALALVPQGEWGDRMLNAFTRQLEQLGGIVVDVQHYAPDQVDFAAPVRKLLNYSGGKQRRQDADYLFLAANPRQARGVRPQLQFFFASDLPVYATSHIYAGRPDPAADQDLDGILFLDMPWMLSDTTPQQAVRQNLASQRPGVFEQFKRLYALGVDAYAVIPELDRLRNSPGTRYEGETGSLSVDGANRVHRQLIWARFQGGVARLLDGVGAP